MNIPHILVTDTYQKLLEHLKYSQSRLVSYVILGTPVKDIYRIEAKCLYKGTKKGFNASVKRAISFSNTEIRVNRDI